MKRISKKESTPEGEILCTRFNDFVDKFSAPFTGTLSKPYEITSVAKNPTAKRPSENDIVMAIPDVDLYLKKGKSPVTFEGLDVVAVYYSKKQTNDNEKYINKLDGFDNMIFLLVNPETGDTIGIEARSGIPYHSLSKEAYDYLNDNSLIVKSDDVTWFVNDSGFEDYHNSGALPGALIIDGHLLINADQDVANDCIFVSSGKFDHYPTVSFNCLGNLIEKEVLLQEVAIETIRYSNLRVVDFTPEERRKVSKALLSDYAKSNKASDFNSSVWRAKQTPPEAGFSLVRFNPMEWHKPSTILLQKDKESYILGQDEGTYFGCVLADNPKSIKGAYESLIPKVARGVKGVIRQGEWFAIPVKDQKKVPNRYSPETLLFADSESGVIEGLSFGIEDEDSNRHVFESGEIVFSTAGIFARNFEITHEEHSTLIGQGNVWYTFAKNTALHSFSAERVD